jgi:uncharacterized oxidoreductase
MRIAHDRLEAFIQAIFQAAGSHQPESAAIARYLVEANLVGHDSHGVIRVPQYIAWLRAEHVVPNQTPEVVFETQTMAIVDGRFGFGQVMGGAAVKIGLEKCAAQGVAVVGLRNSGHLGRIGDWAEMAARAGKISLHFVNTSGAGMLVAPYGGTERRLSANPLAAGVPVAGGAPLILDMSTCTIAEGKIKVALNKGVNIPDGCILDGEGRPSNDPKAFYATPPGAILTTAGHKGFGLSVLVEVLAGAITGGHCTTPGVKRVSNNMLSIFLDPGALPTGTDFAREIADLVAWVKSSPTVEPGGAILMPGEPEQRTRSARLAAGIELDAVTWSQLVETARSLNLPEPVTS